MSVNPYEEADRLSVAEAGSREVESWALLELAKRLDRARKEKADDHPELLEVVRLNWRAWTIIQSSLLDEQNPMTPELRGDLLSLCAFIDKHSTQLLAKPSAEKVQILIDINMHLGQGLRGERLSDAEQQAILKANNPKTTEEETTQGSTQSSTQAQEEAAVTTDAPAALAAAPVAASKKGVQKIETGVAVDL